MIPLNERINARGRREVKRAARRMLRIQLRPWSSFLHDATLLENARDSWAFHQWKREANRWSLLETIAWVRSST